ncbi:MAG: hypothetical protein ACREKH_04320, partial [Candidatus Rokuibacteriota bacterium]
APTCAPEIQPVVVVADFERRDPSSRVSIRECVGAATQGSIAPNFPHVSLSNPSTSRSLLEVYQIAISTNTSQLVVINFPGVAGLVTVGSAQVVDGRLIVGGVLLPTGVILSDAIPATQTGGFRLRSTTGAAANAAKIDPFPFTAWLSPGQALDTMSETTAATLDVTYWWREHAIIA